MTQSAPQAPTKVLAMLRGTSVAVRYLLGGVVLNQMGAFVQTFLVLYLVHRGLSITQAGLSIGAYGAGAVIGPLAAGAVLERLSPRFTIAGSMTIAGLLVMCLPALSHPDRFAALLAVVTVIGAVTAAYRPAASALLAELTPEGQQLMAFSTFRVALNLGAAIGPLVAAGLILVSWDLLFVFDGITALAYAALAVTRLPVGSRDPAEPPTEHVARAGYGVILRDRRFLLYLAAMILSAAVYVEIFTVLPLHVTRDGLPTSVYSAALTLASVMLIACELKITSYVERWLVAGVAGFTGTALLSLGVAGYGLSSGSAVVVLICTIVVVTGVMISGPTMFAYPAKAPATVKGLYLGASHAMFGAGMALGPVLGVTLWHQLGAAIWPICGLVGLASAVCAYFGMNGCRAQVGPAGHDDADPADVDSQIGAEHMIDRPVVVVGFGAVALKSLAELQPDASVVLVVDPDVVRKRDVRAFVASSPIVRELIEWAYDPPGAADEFANRYGDLRPAAVAPLVEYATPFAARLAERYGRPGAGLGAAQLFRDKSLLRKVTRAAGIANPQSEPVDGPEAVRAFMRAHDGAVVLKPADRQAAVGTKIIRDADDAERDWAECADQDEGVMVSDQSHPLRMLVERYVEGDEYSVEMLVRGGSPLFTNVTRKILFPGSRPIELGHVVPAAIPSELKRELHEQTERVVRAVAFDTGIVHCEWIVSAGVPYLVECAGRFAGDGIIEMIERAYPVELVRSYYAVMKGEPLAGPLPVRAEETAVVRFVHVEPGEVVRVDGLDDARRVEGVVVCDVSLRPGDRTHELRSSWDRVGIIMACGPTAAEATRRTEQAAALIDVRLASELVAA